jgi:alpha-L-fucosidase
MNKNFFLCVAVGALLLSGWSAMASPEKLADIAKVASAGPFRPDWDSLARYQVPDWYQNAKFGIFIHWGVYSVPAFGSEWYPREMYQPGGEKSDYEHHLVTYGSLDKFGYKDFIPLFKAENFSPAAWAKLFKDAGARYVVPVAEHHDGFAMYESDYSDWTAAKLGPKRDVIGELAKAMRADGITFGLSNHRAEHWWFYGGGRKIPSDVQDEKFRDLYGPAQDRTESEAGKTPPDQAFMEDWLLRACEQVDKYQPQVVWFDWWIAQPAMQPYVKTFAAYYYNRAAQWGKGVAINYKKFGGKSFPDTAGVLDIERGKLAEIRELFWQTDTSISKTSWGYVTNQIFKSPNSLVDDLVDIVSKNGCLLLNIGPRADGTIPDEAQEILRAMGGWLKLNGEAIYDTRPWMTFGEGPTHVEDGTMKNDTDNHQQEFGAEDFRFTSKGSTVYAIGLAWPNGGGSIKIKSLASGQTKLNVKMVTLLGYAKPLKFTQDKDGLRVELPAESPCDFAYVLRLVATAPVAQMTADR